MAKTQTLEPENATVFAELFAEVVEPNGNAGGTDTWQSWTSDGDA